ncbi:hypothetical protein IDJ77_06545 [Mucilaginibacter sp. ZT4R22]|uniref:DUF4838 domain-containing protein n=1 Tax=Mucilaginibacter pankratovii TaxID=2772110 RepID=A0ABR7WMB1_9SPHI|nr:hypothetical protein [Mucilaginibacter pankratovii]MBD1363463.1 hypothetical protein [Mucilaginibacter pankratovii]
MNFKLSAFITCLFLVAAVSGSRAQDGGVIIPKNINLPQDTVSKQIVIALNGFLSQKEKPNKDNSFVLKDELLETSALLDEMKGIEQNVTLKVADFYRPYLTNVVKQGENRYAVQFSYIGVAGDTPLMRASFKLLAKQVNGRFYFYSPLRQNTSSWKVKSHGAVSFHYRDTLSFADAKEFIRMVALYNKKLNTNKPIILYYCTDFLEVQQLLGIEYMADNAGLVSNQLGADENNTDLIINGWSTVKNRFDPHDLFHDRLRTVMSSAIINRPVDEGCAYLYGGSWGKSWPEVSAMFNVYVKDNPGADWLQLYLDGKNYYNDGGKIFKISYMINALIVQKLEKEKGFAAVIELLSCGKKEAGDANYFKALEKLTGINKANFNTEVSKLIKGS